MNLFKKVANKSSTIKLMTPKFVSVSLLNSGVQSTRSSNTSLMGSNQKMTFCDRRGYGKCFNCGELGHVSSSCTKPRAAEGTRSCFICGKSGHVRRDCPERQSSMKCYNCGEMGHISNDCTKQRADTRKCFNCGQGGHLSRNCPERI